MKLKSLTYAAILSIIYLFIVRMVGTVSISYNQGTVLLLVKLLLNFASYFIIILFLLQVIKQFIPEEEIGLLNATMMLILGILAVLIINVVNGISEFLPASMNQSTIGRYYTNMLFWVYGFIMNLFFLYMYKYSLKLKDNSFRLRSGLGFAGAVAGFFINSVNLLNYFFYFQNLKKFLDLQRGAMVVLGSLLILFSFLTKIVFLVGFSRMQRHHPSAIE